MKRKRRERHKKHKWNIASPSLAGLSVTSRSSVANLRRLITKTGPSLIALHTGYPRLPAKRVIIRHSRNERRSLERQDERAIVQLMELSTYTLRSNTRRNQGDGSNFYGVLTHNTVLIRLGPHAPPPSICNSSIAHKYASVLIRTRSKLHSIRLRATALLCVSRDVYPG